jgi:hypothetical protein
MSKGTFLWKEGYAEGILIWEEGSFEEAAIRRKAILLKKSP